MTPEEMSRTIDLGDGTFCCDRSGGGLCGSHREIAQTIHRAVREALSAKRAGSEGARLDAAVQPLTVGDDPEIEIYHVELSHEGGMWTETFGSKELLDAFLKGLRAASGMMGFELRRNEDVTA